AYLEATAFGAKMIMQQYQGWQMEVDHVFACGGIPKKNGLLMEIYANILNKKITVIDSEYAPAIGAAILGAICGGAHPDFNSAIEAMKEPVLYQVEPDPQQVRIYKKLFSAYKELHDLHGYKKARIMRNVSALM
ncbi:MAG: FGGY-family carbohydrate kinase, partial [Staphylococcus xylosus]|nr:FGGY-family carbohydrate kinase [Staphylococcus xylosus]